MGIKISALTKREYEAIKAEANFTPNQLKIYEALNRDEIYDQGIMNELKMSPREYYELKKITLEKAFRLALELGFAFAIKPKEHSDNSEIKTS